MASVHDVAAYILSRRGPMSTMKLQKLCYYSQGWSLAWDEQPIFDEAVQAWANGPVVYELFAQHRGKFRVTSWPWGHPEKLTPDEVETIEGVLGAYGHLTGQQLSDMSHSEPPWVEARRGLPNGSYSSAEISQDAMQVYFSALAQRENEILEDDDIDEVALFLADD